MQIRALTYSVLRPKAFRSNANLPHHVGPRSFVASPPVVWLPYWSTNIYLFLCLLEPPILHMFPAHSIPLSCALI